MTRRKLMYLMHPLGSGADRERNRQLACCWQAAIQERQPDWLVVAPWIALSGAWTEERREDSMAVDFATIDLCDGGIVAGVKTGPKDVGPYKGVSPGMAEEIQYFADTWPMKDVLDVRDLIKIELPPAIAAKHRFKPRFEVGQEVIIENRRGKVVVLGFDQPSPGVFRYRVRSSEEFFAYEQSIAGKA